MSRKVRGGFPFLTWIVLLLTTALQASEWKSYPTAAIDLRPHFDTYVATSEASLKALDGLTSSKNKVADEWGAISRRAVLELNRAQVAAREQHRKEGKGELPPELVAWCKLELESWHNVSDIGHDLITVHDKLIFAQELIQAADRDHKAAVGVIRGDAKLVDQFLGKILKYEDLNSHATGTDTALESLTSRALTDIGRLALRINKVSEHVQEQRNALERANYKGQVEAIARKGIDPDGKGTFLAHERKWELDLSQRLSEYEATYAAYLASVKGLESYEVIYVYDNLRGMPHKANEAVKWAEAKINNAIKRSPPPPQLEANDIRLTTNAIPRKMTVGEDQLLEVMVNNAGKAPLPAGWVVKCEVTQSPSGADPDGLEYTTGKGPEIPAGRGMRVRQGVKAPQGVGRWTLSWTLVSGSKTLAKAQANVELEGEAEAELGSTSTPRDIEQGRNGALTVNVKNTGNAPLAANNFNVHVKVRRAPNGYRATNKDFATILRSRNAVGPGAEARLQGALTPPADPKAVGDWQLELQLKVAGRVVESKTFSVRVKP